MTKSKLEIDMNIRERFEQMAHSLDKGFDETLAYLMESFSSQASEIKNITAELNTYKERELEAFLIGDALNDGIYIVDAKGIVIAVNKVFSQLTGIKEEEIIGQPIEYMSQQQLVKKPIGRVVLEKKEKISAVHTLNNQKIVITGNPIFDEAGNVVQALIVLRDVTELNRLKEQLEQSEKITQKYIDELQYFRLKEIQKSELIGHSSSMQKLRELIIQLAQVDVTVLITGETGVGKEVVAREIHKNSPRKDAPYIKVNCAAIPETLLESELFGYERGAFTGASNKEKLGLFEIANSGTILLDEIGEMPVNLQSKLLRVLQEKEIRRIGGAETIKLDVRVLAATNQNLEQQVAEGKFRQDLYYRLNVIPVVIPPLRSRQDDIPLFINHFLKKYNEKYNQNKGIDLSAVELMQQHHWPGNVRELENIIEQLVVIIKEPIIGTNNIKKIIDSRSVICECFQLNDFKLREAVEMVERQVLENAIKKHGSTRKAAKALGVSQPTVVRKLKELGLS